MASIFPRFPNGRAKALTLSYDDGVEQDIRLIDIMNRNGLKGTFNLNSGLYTPEGTVFPKGQIHRRMSAKRVGETYRESGQEVAVHTLTHPFLEQLPVSMAAAEVLHDRENLESQFGTIVRGMAYPFGTYSDGVVEVLKSCGIVYSRTTCSTNRFDLPTDWLRLNPTCHHNSPELKSLAEKFVTDEVTRVPYLFYLWGHSYEFEARDNWQVIEEFAGYMGGRDTVWYATNIEIYDYMDAWHRLLFSADGRRVKNPTDRNIWFQHSDRIVEVDAGAMAEIGDR